MSLNRKSFTYADPHQSLPTRLFIQAVESLTGKGKLWSVYREYQKEPKKDGEFFWAAALRKLNISAEYDVSKLENIPKEGGLLVLANHPFGIADGLVLCDLVSRQRPDHKILINSVLRHAEEAKPLMLPIDFSGTREAIETNLQSRKDARQWLKDGHCLIVFPAGGVSDIGVWGNKVAWDRAWQPFVGSLIKQTKPTILPVYIEGQNSTLFQWASVTAMFLRLALFLRETVLRMNGTVKLHFGKTIAYEALPEGAERDELCDYLYAELYALGGHEDAQPFLPPFRTEFKVYS